MLAHEALGKHFLEWVKKETASEEKSFEPPVVPITILGISGAILAIAMDHIRETPRDFGLLILLGTFIAYLAFATLTLIWVTRTGRQRQISYPPDEVQMIAYARAEEASLRAAGLTAAPLKEELDQRLGETYLDAYARIIQESRALNSLWIRNRSEAVFFACGALVSSFALMVYLVVRMLGRQIPG